MDWIESLIQNYGVAAMFVLIMLEYACFPVSSEIILPLAGLWLPGRGCFFHILSFGNGSRTDWGTDSVWHWQVWRFSTVGTHYETFFFYGETNPNLLPCLWQSRKSAVLVSRVIPLCRTYIGFVAGAMGQNISRYLLYSAIGIVTWNTVLTGLGYYFYQYKDLFFHYFDKYKHVIFIQVLSY